MAISEPPGDSFKIRRFWVGVMIFSTSLNPIRAFFHSPPGMACPFSHLPSLERLHVPCLLKPSPQARGTPAYGHPLPCLHGAGPSTCPDLWSCGRRGLCSSGPTLPPASGAQACPACWTSAPRSPGQLDPSLPAADRSPRGWPPSATGPARPAQGRGGGGARSARERRHAGMAPTRLGALTRPAASLTTAARARR